MIDHGGLHSDDQSISGNNAASKRQLITGSEAT